jgi:Ca-activated chloride channel family protein
LKQSSNQIEITSKPSCQYALGSGETRIFVQLQLKTSDYTSSQEKRSPFNLGVSLDRSGSMGGAKIEKAKKAVKFIVENMTREDIFSLVIYDDEIDTLIPANKVTDKSVIINKINTVTARNMTNLFDGMMRSVDEVQKNRNLEFKNILFLLSDGLANVGIVSKSQVASSASDVHEKEGISISTFGIGEDFDEDMLVGISDAASGEFYFIQTADDIPKYIEKEFQGLLETIASNIIAKINLAKGVKLNRILGLPLRDQGRNKLKLGDLRSSSDRIIILDLLLPGGDLEEQQEIVTVDFEWISPEQISEKQSFNSSCTITFTEDEEKLTQESQSILDRVAILETALTREKAISLADLGKFSDAQELISKQQSILKARSKLVGALPELKAVMRENKNLLDNTFQEKEYTKLSRKMVSSMTYNLRKQRKD